MLVLIETAAGYSLFSVKKKGLFEEDADTICKKFEEKKSNPKSLIALESFSRFKDTKAALSASTAIVESKLDKGLKKFLKKEICDKEISDKLIVSDKALGGVIKSKLGIEVVYSTSCNEIIKGIRTHLSELLDVPDADLKQLSLALSHTMNRFKLKFSPEKVDTMIVQAIGLLDDLDRELNNFAMRLKEWYGWHFPELAKIVTDNVLFAKSIQQLGFRTNSRNVDLSDLLTEDIAKEVAQAAEISMGTEITEEDLTHILDLAERVVELTDYRQSLAEYLKFRMAAIAPNLTHMVGELVGARLIAHAGSLLGLAKHPSSTVQILGAEKALFRALKTKKQTPKYGLIYHATLVGQAAPKLKGKISRVLAAKMSLAIRVDALGDQTDPTVGIEGRDYVERRLEHLADGGTSILKNPPLTQPKFTAPKPGQRGSYGPGADVVSVKQEKKKAKTTEAAEPDVDMGEGGTGAAPAKTPKTKKRRASVVEETEEVAEAAPAKKKKKKSKTEDA